ncbi:MAG TPA: cytochrome c biogenesis protein ResB [Thermodesulfovibrionales bacterium]|nr:cytochrome c biogenesis protein ResB [Thermodesulfovibrionales bacterium]
MKQEKNKSFIDKIWNFFASVRFAVLIFTLIAATSVVGTVLEQRAEQAKNIQVLSRIFGESAAPGLYTFFNALGFMDMYRSWWFLALLVLFAVNLIVCSLDRLPRIWSLATEPISPLPEETIKKFLIHKEFTIKGSMDSLRDLVLKAAKGIGFSCSVREEEKGLQFLAQKGNYSRLGVYLTHFSILIILAGALVGGEFGFKGFMEVGEGTVSNTAFGGGKELNLDFYVRCDNFDVEFYGMSDMPKEYRSWLTVIKNGKEVMKKSITVNDPLTYEGITFYQSSYGLIPNSLGNGIFIFSVVSKDGKSSVLNLRMGDSFQIPGTNVTGKIQNFSPALRIMNGQPFTYADMMNNPAVFIDFTEAGKHLFSGWIFKRNPETWQLPDGNRVEFDNYWGVEYTGLQVRKDPGVWVVYLGCILMSIGLFIAFFMSHQKLWVKLVQEKSGARIIIGANTNKNRGALERKIEKLASVLNSRQGGDK